MQHTFGFCANSDRFQEGPPDSDLYVAIFNSALCALKRRRALVDGQVDLQHHARQAAVGHGHVASREALQRGRARGARADPRPPCEPARAAKVIPTILDEMRTRARYWLTTSVGPRGATNVSGALRAAARTGVGEAWAVAAGRLLSGGDVDVVGASDGIARS